MRLWWVRTLVRLVVAVGLPFAVPCIIVYLIWSLPGDPASIICPPEMCPNTEALAARWNLDQGPWHFFTSWWQSALEGDFGRSWRLEPGTQVADRVFESIGPTVALVALAALLNGLGALGALTGLLSRRFHPLIQVVGLVPALVLALVASAAITLGWVGEGGQLAARVGLGALALGVADAALSSTVSGVHSLVQSERLQRYAQMAVLRGEGVLSNILPNTLPALAGQLRARMVQLLSGAVVVEVVLEIDGLGDLLWRATLQQDFVVVVAAAFFFALMSAALLFFQALVEVACALWVRRTPGGVAP